MKIIKCDACGNEVNLDHPIMVTFHMFDQSSQEDVEYDICAECWGRVIRLLSANDNGFSRLEHFLEEVVAEGFSKTPS